MSFSARPTLLSPSLLFYFLFSSLFSSSLSSLVDTEAVVLDYLSLNPPTVTPYTRRRFQGLRATNAELIFYARRKSSLSLIIRAKLVRYTHYHHAFSVKCPLGYYPSIIKRYVYKMEKKLACVKIERITTVARL